MNSPSRVSGSKELGFTLAEIAVAVAVLGLALTTLVGLHTSMLNTYFNENNRIKAGFYARYIMTMLEVAADPPSAGSDNGDLAKHLESYGYFGSDDSFKSKNTKVLDGWTFDQTVTNVDLPLLEDALRRIDLEISWGETEDQYYHLIYFVNSDEAESTDSSGGIGGVPPGGGFGTNPAGSPPTVPGGPTAGDTRFGSSQPGGATGGNPFATN